MVSCHGDGAIEKGCGPGRVISFLSPWEASTSWVFLYGVKLWDRENFKVRQTLDVTRWFLNSYKGERFFNHRNFCMEAE